jgi:hypothetical protein
VSVACAVDSTQAPDKWWERGAWGNADQVLQCHGLTGDVIHGDVEVAHALPTVKVQCDHAVGTRTGDEVGCELGGDGLAPRRLAIRACVPVATLTFLSAFSGLSLLVAVWSGLGFTPAPVDASLLRSGTSD